MKRKGRKSRVGADRVGVLLDIIGGKANDTFDRRYAERGQQPRFLEISRNADTFARLVRNDFDYLRSLRFAADPSSLDILLPQSVLGRAENGHGWFMDDDGSPLRFVDATFDRVLSVLEKDDPAFRSDRVRTARQETIERVLDHLATSVGIDPIPLVDNKGPLLGVSLLEGLRVDAKQFFTGFALAGLMDEYAWRRRTVTRRKKTFGGRPLFIGGGEIHVVNRERYRAVGLPGKQGRVFTCEDFSILRDADVIVIGDGQQEFPYPEYEQAFFRVEDELGVCDDLAMMWLNARYGFSAMIGGFIMDGLDTYDKYLGMYRPGGFDRYAARTILALWRQRYGEDLLSQDDVIDLIHFAAKQNDPVVPISSSHRRFIQFEDGCDTTTIMNHHDMVTGAPVCDIRLGFNRLPAKDFYADAHKRFRAAGIDVPEPTFRKIRK